MGTAPARHHRSICNLSAHSAPHALVCRLADVHAGRHRTRHCVSRYHSAASVARVGGNGAVCQHRQLAVCEWRRPRSRAHLVGRIHVCRRRTRAVLAVHRGLVAGSQDASHPCRVLQQLSTATIRHRQYQCDGRRAGHPAAIAARGIAVRSLTGVAPASRAGRRCVHHHAGHAVPDAVAQRVVRRRHGNGSCVDFALAQVARAGIRAGNLRRGSAVSGCVIARTSRGRLRGWQPDQRP